LMATSFAEFIEVRIARAVSQGSALRTKALVLLN
jgi:hypothetical protein